MNKNLFLFFYFCFFYIYYYLRGFSYLDFILFFQFINGLTPLYLSRDKIKRQSSINAILTLILYYYLRGFPCLDSSFFLVQKCPTPMFKQRQTKEQSGKNAILTLTKILPKKQNHSPINFQIDLFTYKLDFQNKNYIYIYITQFFFFYYKIGPLKTKNEKGSSHACVIILVNI